MVAPVDRRLAPRHHQALDRGTSRKIQSGHRQHLPGLPSCCQNGRNVLCRAASSSSTIPRVLQLVNVDAGDFLGQATGKPVAIAHRDEDNGIITHFRLASAMGQAGVSAARAVSAP